MKTLKMILYLLSFQDRIKIFLLLIGILLMAFVDMIGVASILPFMAILTNSEIIETNKILKSIFEISKNFGVENKEDFLILIGLRSILNKEKLNLEKKTLKDKTISFLQGFSISIFNPKIFVWFVAIYSQFMSIENKFIFNVYLISIAGIVDACWYIILTFAVTTASALKLFQTKLNIIQKIQGFFFIALGLVLIINLFL